MPSAHVVYGESQTINSASYVQTRAFAEAARLSNPHAVSILCGQSKCLMPLQSTLNADSRLEELENLYTGQSLDLFWKFHIHCPSEKEYLEMVDGSKPTLWSCLLPAYVKVLGRNWRPLSLDSAFNAGGEPGHKVKSLSWTPSSFSSTKSGQGLWAGAQVIYYGAGPLLPNPRRLPEPSLKRSKFYMACLPSFTMSGKLKPFRLC